MTVMSRACFAARPCPRRVTGIALVWLIAGCVAIAGCGRRGEFAPVGHLAANGESVEILAPGGELGAGKNELRVRLTHLADHSPIDASPKLEMVQQAAGSAPLRVPVPLTRRAAGEFEGKASLEAQGMWWADITFNGSDGTQTMRVRVKVGK